MKVVVIHRREFKGSKQIKHLFTEFGVANYPAYRAGVLGVEDDNGVLVLLVMRGMHGAPVVLLALPEEEACDLVLRRTGIVFAQFRQRLLDKLQFLVVL